MLVPYAVKLAFQSMFREKWINFLSMLTIASGLLVMSLAFFIIYNIDIATKKLPEKFSLLVYLDDNLPQERIDQVINDFRKHPAVSSLNFISKQEAMKELKGILKNSSYVFEGLEENPLPDTLELKLKQDAVGPEAVKKMAEEASRIEGVNEVNYGENFLSTIYSIKAGVKILGMILSVIFSTGIIFVCYSTVKILFYRRNAEIETFKLLGATKAFIRLPFFIEGAFIGTIGGIFSLVFMLAFYYIVLLRLISAIPVFKAVLFPNNVFLLLPALGLFLGTAGAAIAIGRLKY